MADYKRFISYLYEYGQDGEKGSAGHLRVEVKQGKYRMTVKLHAKKINGVCEMYFYIRKPEKLYFISIGTTEIVDGEAEFCSEGETDNLGENKDSFDLVDGMVLFGKDGRYIAADWENLELTHKQAMQINKREDRKNYEKEDKEKKNEKVEEIQKNFKQKNSSNQEEILSSSKIKQTPSKIINDIEIEPSVNHAQNKETIKQESEKSEIKEQKTVNSETVRQNKIKPELENQSLKTLDSADIENKEKILSVKEEKGIEKEKNLNVKQERIQNITEITDAEIRRVSEFIEQRIPVIHEQKVKIEQQKEIKTNDILKTNDISSVQNIEKTQNMQYNKSIKEREVISNHQSIKNDIEIKNRNNFVNNKDIPNNKNIGKNQNNLNSQYALNDKDSLNNQYTLNDKDNLNNQYALNDKDNLNNQYILNDKNNLSNQHILNTQNTKQDKWTKVNENNQESFNNQEAKNNEANILKDNFKISETDSNINSKNKFDNLSQQNTELQQGIKSQQDIGLQQDIKSQQNIKQQQNIESQQNIGQQQNIKQQQDIKSQQDTVTAMNATAPSSIPYCGNRRLPWQDAPEARDILDNNMRMYPFQDGELAECVRIEPKDIGRLPMEFWVLGNNSFLLHSYCNYKYLLFAKRMNRIRCEYLLMVPGVYQHKEKMMAKMFGFEHFKCSRCREQRHGEFGYWYIPLIF